MTTNDAAERLRQWLAVDGRYVDAHPTIDRLVDAALAEAAAPYLTALAALVAALDDVDPFEPSTQQPVRDALAAARRLVEP